MNKHKDLKQLAIIGLMSGILVAQNAVAAETKSSSPSNSTQSSSNDANASNMNYHLMTEDELFLELSPEGIKMYKSLSPEGKALALKVASMMCAGSNLCAGLNACKTDKNECAGKGSCRGKGKCGLNDKDLAVKLVKEKMEKKRANLTPVK